jgi:predicted peptidase
LFVPRDYSTDRKYPVVLFHHGGGGAGGDNRKQHEGACVRDWIRPTAQAKHPCFIVAPQSPGKKSQASTKAGSPFEVMRRRIRTIHEILDKLEEEFSIDESREYVTGLSFGGECTWLSIVERPDRFAAAVPICAGNRLMDIPLAERGRKFASFPLGIFHGDAD